MRLAERACGASKRLQKFRYTMGKFPRQPVKRACMNREGSRMWRRSEVEPRRITGGGHGKSANGFTDLSPGYRKSFDRTAKSASPGQQTSIEEVKYTIPAMAKARLADANEIRRWSQSVRRRRNVPWQRWASRLAGRQTPSDVRRIRVTGRANFRADGTECPDGRPERLANDLKFELISRGNGALGDGMAAAT